MKQISNKVFLEITAPIESHIFQEVNVWSKVDKIIWTSVNNITLNYFQLRYNRWSKIQDNHE